MPATTIPAGLTQTAFAATVDAADVDTAAETAALVQAIHVRLNLMAVAINTLSDAVEKIDRVLQDPAFERAWASVDQRSLGRSLRVGT